MRYSALLAVLPAFSCVAQFESDDVEVLWTADAEIHNDQYAWQCEAIGDIHGDDGVQEIVVTAPFHSVGSPRFHGTAYIYNGATGELLHKHQGTILNGCLGFRAFAAGDHSGDGVPDYILTQAGAQGNTTPNQGGGIFPGYINLYSGADHKLLLRLESPTPEGRLGIAATVLDDITGDGVAEILGGAPQSNANGNGSGAAYVFDGVTGNIIRTHTGNAAGDIFGNGITVTPDVTGDGIRDYAIGSIAEGDYQRGRVRIFDAASGDLLHTINPNNLAGGETAVDFGRFFMSVAGDVDGDGRDDLYLADWYDQVAGSISGRVWIIDPAIPEPGEESRVVQRIDGTAQGEWFGFGRGFPDVDGDGKADLLICSYGLNNFKGAVGLYSGASGERLRFIVRESTVSEQFGYDACSPGDINGDGIPDIIVTEAGSLAPSDRGRVWAIAGVDHTPCDADVNHDGAVTPTDFTAWVYAFNNLLPECDQNRDNICSPTDFTAWLGNYSAGC